MAPPVKRRKRVIVLSSEDEASSAERKPKPIPTISRAKKTKNETRELGSKILPKDQAAKSKSAGKARTLMPISLFFRAEAQTPQLNNQKPPEAVTSALEDLEDLIVDDSSAENVDDLREIATRTDLDGRRERPVPAYDNAAAMNRSGLPSGIQRFKIPGHASNVDTVPGISSAANARQRAIDLRPWAEKYGPNSLEELMVHKKKVSDVRNWLEDALRGQHPKVHFLKAIAGRPIADCE